MIRLSVKLYKLIRIFLFLTLAVSRPCKAETPKVLEHTGGDIVSTFANWPVLILAGGVAAAVISHPLDDNVQHYFSNHHFSTTFDDVGKWVGDPYILGSASLVVYGTSLLTKNEEFQRTSETMVEALLFNALITESLKYSFGRTRPDGGSHSFPSGHASTMFTIASVLQSMEGWQYGVPTYVAASAIAFSRLDANRHFLSDVVFGAALGSCIGWGTSRFHKKESTRLMISPILDNTRGIMLSYKF